MTRSFNKKQFKLREHLERLYASMKYVNINLKMTIDEMEKACYETIEKNEPYFDAHDEHRLMINVTRGPLSLYAEVFGNQVEPIVCIADFPLKWTVAAMGTYLENGINVVIPNQRAIPSHLLDAKVKSRSRIHYLRANVEVSNYSGVNTWALLLDPDGFITEGTGSNFFLVKNNVLYTPEARNILKGISRDYVIELAKEMGITVVEKNLDQLALMTADEAFMTATPFCILPVTRFCNDNIGTGQMGSLTKRLLEKWSENVGLNIPEQILKYSKEVAEHRVNAASPYSFKK